VTAQPNTFGELNSTLSQVANRFSPPQDCEKQDETISVTAIRPSQHEELIGIGYSNVEIAIFNRQ
jgi:hypothetical protein